MWGRFHRCVVVFDLKRSCMASTHLSLHYHLVFSTKNREPWLSPTHRQRVHSSIGGMLRNMDGIAHAVGGTGDHIHIAGGLRATHCLADVMRRGEERVLTLDSRGTAAGGLCLAGGLWRVHLCRARFGGRTGLCFEPGGASSREDLSGRIHGDAETRHGGV